MSNVGPIKKQIVVAASVERAFSVFTDGIKQARKQEFAGRTRAGQEASDQTDDDQTEVALHDEVP